MINFHNSRRAFVLAAGLATGLAVPLLFVASCGVEEPARQDSALEEWKPQPRDSRFSADEIAAVFSDGTKVVGGKTYPDSKAPLKFIYTAANAPETFKAEYGDFNAGAEIKGYINLGFTPSQGFQSRYVGNFEKISTWKTIKDATGKAIFDNAFTTNARGARIDDWSDGQASPNGEIHFGTLALKTNTPIGSISVPATVTIYNRGGEIQVDVINAKDVRAPIVGTVIKAQGLKIHLKAFPHEKGWLVYAASAVKLEKFQDALKAEDLQRYIDALFNWIKDSTVLPLR